MMIWVERFLSLVAIFFIVYMFLYTAYLFISVTYGALHLFKRDQMARLRNELKHGYYMPVSILIPAYNEAITIVSNINSLLNVDYKLYEIIIVDDGSTDGTSEALINTFNMKKTSRPIHLRLKTKAIKSVYEVRIDGIDILLIRKANGGKGDALNAGINVSRFPYFITIDADSMLQKNAIEKIMQPILENPDIVAVGGMIRVAQCVSMKDGYVSDYKMPWRPIVGMQVVEYDRSFLASRILLNQFKGNLIISGAFGLFKKDIVTAIGGYNTVTLGEDMELVMRLHLYIKNNAQPFLVHYEPQAICWSQSPSKLSDLIKQRRRWYLGLFQSMTKYPQMMMRFRFGKVGFISYTYFFVFELMAPFIEVFGLVTIVIASVFNLLNIPFMISLFLVYNSYGIILSLTAFFQRVYTQGLKLHVLDIVKAFLMVVLENFFFRYVLAFVRVTAFMGYKKKRNEWGNITRTKQVYAKSDD